MVIPGTRKLQWRLSDVRAWLEAFAELERERRDIAAHYKTLTTRPTELAGQNAGIAASNRLAEKKARAGK